MPCAWGRRTRRGGAHAHFDFPGASRGVPRTSRRSTGRRARWRARARSFEDIAGKRIGVSESVGEYLVGEQPKIASAPLERLPPATSTVELLEEVAKGKLDYALVESTRFSSRGASTRARDSFNVGKPLDYAWLISTVDKRRSPAPRRRSSSTEEGGTVKRPWTATTAMRCA